MANRKTTAPPPKFIAVDALRHADDTVSYTHLTLPTSDLV